jgi:hypothetical protein
LIFWEGRGRDKCETYDGGGVTNETRIKLPMTKKLNRSLQLATRRKVDALTELKVHVSILDEKMAADRISKLPIKKLIQE